MSPHYFHTLVDHVFNSVLESPELIYIDDCCGHKIVDAAFDVIEEHLAAIFKSLKFVIEACCEPKITYQSFMAVSMKEISRIRVRVRAKALSPY